MKFKEYVESIYKELKMNATGRHGSQRYTYTTILLNALLSEDSSLKNADVINKEQLRDIIWEGAHELRLKFGYEWDNAQAQVKDTEVYTTFSAKLKESGALAAKVLLYKSSKGELACKFP